MEDKKIIFTEEEINKYLAMIGEIPTKYGMPIVQSIQIDAMRKKKALQQKDEKTVSDNPQPKNPALKNRRIKKEEN